MAFFVARMSTTDSTMITGISTMLTMNALLWTSVANSDWATIRILRMVPRLLNCGSRRQGFAIRTKMSCSDGRVTSK